MSRTHKLRIRPLIAALMLTACRLAQADATTDRAKQLIDAGDAKAAYDLLIPLESERAGDQTYDLLLGIAAADIGRNTNAVMALERVLAQNPNNARARAEIARAYFALGEVRTARQEFETVKQQGIPPEVAGTIDRFLSAVERIEDSTQTTVRTFVEASAGWDSNANGGSSASNVAIPALGGLILTLGNAGTKQSDGYFGLAAGVNARKPIDPQLALTAGFTASQRINNTWDIFDTGSWDGNVGLMLTQDKDIYSLNLQAGTFFVDNERYRDTIGLSAQWQHNYDKRNQATLFVQYADQSYPRRAQWFMGDERDSERWTLGAGFAHALQDQRTVFYGSAYAGIDNARKQRTDQLDQNFYGLRGGAQYQFRNDLSLFASVSWEQRDYQGEDGFFLRKRSDDTYSLGVGAIYMPAKGWKVTPQYQRIDNRSNIRLNTYDRDVISITVRKDF